MTTKIKPKRSYKPKVGIPAKDSKRDLEITKSVKTNIDILKEQQKKYVSKLKPKRKGHVGRPTKQRP